MASNFSTEKQKLLDELLALEEIETALGQAIPRIGGQDLPLSYAQQRLWFLQEFINERRLYNVPMVVRIKGRLQIEVLERALSEIVRRHESLRTSIVLIQGKPVQRIEAAEGVKVALIDLTGEKPGGRKRREEAVIGEQIGTTFDLGQGPLFRVSVVKVGEEEHVLVVVVHHIISDGWSLEILKRELRELYGGYSRGGEVKLEELPIQYGDYAVWQREWLAGGVLEKQLEYWRKQLEGVPEVLELTISKGRGAVQGHEGGRWRFELGKEQVNGLKELSQQQGVTLFMVVLCGFQIVLERYSGQKDVVVGSPVAGRNRREVEGLIGFFVNTLVLRGEVRGEKKVGEMLQEIREMTLEAYSNQDVPFEKLVEELQPERDMSRSPLFQVMLVLQNAPEEKWELGGMEVEPEEVNRGVAKFDLTLQLEEEDGCLNGVLIYRRELMEEEGVKGIGRHLQVVLGEMVKKPESRIGELEMLEEEERRQVVEEWNRTGVRYEEGERSLQELFEEQVRRTPGGVAVGWRGEEISYEELNRRANRVGHYLRKQGVKAESRVGLCMERGIGLVVGVLGVLKAGGAYVPLDASYPAERLRYMAEDAEIEVLLSEQNLRGSIPGYAGPSVYIDAQSTDIEHCSDENPKRINSSENLAYVLYTSGSTGKPKGVSIEHRQLVNYVLAVSERMAVPNCSFAMVQPLTVDSSVTALFPPLIAGGCVYVVSRETALDPVRMNEFFSTNKVDGLKIAPSHLGALHGAGALIMPEQVLVIGGESSQWSWVNALKEMKPGCKVFNHYGPTETTVGVLTYLQQAQSVPNGNTPLGKPLANTKVYVLDENMNPLPLRVAGELYIGGENVARGYLGKPEVTAEKFLPDPFSGNKGSRLYRTGDRVSRLPDGNIDFLGRQDDQIKLRGYRIELGEIEAAVAAFETVRQAVVLVKEDKAGQKRLVAYVVPTLETDLNVSALRRHVEANVPDYMVPSSWVVMKELPRSAHGKLDRAALPEPDEQASSAGYIPPQTMMEELLAGIWMEILKTSRIGLQDNFFRLGGHSLTAMQVVTRIREIAAVDMPVRELFEYPTLGRLTERVNSRLNDQHCLPTVHIPHVQERQDLPLSYAQQRLWFLQEFINERRLYNVPMVVRIKGRLQIEVLERALSEIVRRHESLRTSIVLIQGKPVQRIEAAEGVKVALIDLTGEKPGGRKRREEAVIGEQIGTTFDLGQGPLFRVSVVKVGEEEHVLVVVMHHIISDGWSLGILKRELRELYGGYSRGGEVKLEELPIQYGDYAVWQREWLAGGVLEKQLEYWRKQLEGVPEVLELTISKGRGAVQGHEGGRWRFELGKEQVNGLKELSQQQGVTLFMVVLCGFQIVLERYSGQKDVVVGSPVAGRNRREVEGLIGFFVNTLVLRGEVRGEKKVGEMLQEIREMTLEAYSNQDVPFEKLVEELQPERDMSRSPLFQVMLVLQNAPEEKWELGGMEVEPEEVEGGFAKFDLTLQMKETAGGGMQGVLAYRRELMEEEGVKGIGRHLQVVLGEMVKKPESRIGELEMLEEEERRQVVEEWNRTGVRYEEGERSLQELFEEQVRRTPGGVAVGWRGEEISYEELNRRANRVGHYLRKQGVKAESRVGLCMERGIGLVVGVLGVLKAGGAYVPLDASYPAERLRYMAEDAEIEVLLTERKGAMGEKLKEIGSGMVCVELDGEQEWEEMRGEWEENPGVEVSGENAVYVIYTSGSTGKPKGVVMEQRNAVELVRWGRRWYREEELRCVLFSTSVSFDLSVFEMFVPLSVGGRVEVVENALELVERRGGEGGVTLINTVPSAMVELVRMKAIPESVRVVNLAGEALERGLVEQIYKEGAGVERVVNLYGPTEDTTYSTFLTVERGGEGGVGIGVAISNGEAYVLDEEQRVQPVGVAGEIYLGGGGVARGYLKRAELTAERFVPDGVGRRAGGRLYRTGDRGRWRRDGKLEYLGRADQQVKVRGYRIELGEIETVLKKVEGVEQGVVVVRGEEEGQKRLVGYVVWKEGSRKTGVEQLKERLRRELPEYMVPAVVVELQEMPLSANGKIARNRLPEPGGARLAGEKVYRGPRNELEEVLAGIWAEVLHVERVGIDDNFFALGGHSLLAMQLISRIRQTLRTDISVRVIFNCPEITGFAEKLVSSQQKPGQIEKIARMVLRVQRMTADEVSMGLKELGTEGE